jgi:flagellar basal body-associated protein FliL
MDTNAEPVKKDMFWWITGGAVAAVIGIGTCVYLLFSKSKKAEEKKAEAAPAAEPVKQAA